MVPDCLSAAGAPHQRPGEMVRRVEGLTIKVLNGCLRKNLEFGILEKQVFNELPPRVEYRVTPFGERFMGNPGAAGIPAAGAGERRGGPCLAQRRSVIKN